MPRGNDAAAALSDLASKFGKGVGNAEELIEASLKFRSQALRRAELLPIDEKATKALDLSDLHGPDGERVVTATVRGGTTVIVYEDSRGAYRLSTMDDVLALEAEDGKPSPPKKPPAKAPDLAATPSK